MLVGRREYGTWSDGSSVYKDKKGYYIVAVSNAPNGDPSYKKYLKGWRPVSDSQLCFSRKKWGKCKTKENGTRKKS